MPKTSVGFRFSDDTLRLIERLAKILGTNNKTVTVEMAIHAFARSHKLK